MRAVRKFLTATLVCCVLALMPSTAESGTPRRPTGAYYFGPEVVYTNGAAADFWNPLSEPMSSRALMSARVTMEITESATAAKIKTRPALRWSSDGVTWDAPVAINAAYVTGDGMQATTGFTDFMGLGSPKPFVQFGVLTWTVSGANYELARATLVVEPKAATQ